MSKINVEGSTRLGQVMKAGCVGCEWLIQWLMAHRPGRTSQDSARAKQGVDCHSTCGTLEIRSNKAVASHGINFGCKT